MTVKEYLDSIDRNDIVTIESIFNSYEVNRNVGILLDDINFEDTFVGYLEIISTEYNPCTRSHSIYVFE